MNNRTNHTNTKEHAANQPNDHMDMRLPLVEHAADAAKAKVDQRPPDVGPDNDDYKFDEAWRNRFEAYY
jgi:hypothetical protein